MQPINDDLKPERGGIWVLIGVLLIGLFLGCASDKAAERDPFFEKWKAEAERSKAYSPGNSIKSIDLLEKANESPIEEKAPVVPQRPLPSQKVSLRMHDTDVPVLLRALARLVDQNIMINANVKGKINVNAKAAPWDQVFTGILSTCGLTYKWEGDIIRILTMEDMEHDLQIESLQEKRKVQEIGLKRVEPLMTKVVEIDYADANKLKANLQEFLTKDSEGKPRGTVLVDEHTNALIIQAIRDDIIRMTPLIEALDRPTPQILIEANIVETTRETARELGIQWGGLDRHGDYWITPGANSGGVMGQSLTQSIDPTTGMAANFPAELTDDIGLTLGYVTQDTGKYLLNVQLSALQKLGKLHILSSPSITTVDNQKASIESGAEIPYQTVDRDGNIDIEWKVATLKLEVTPHVIEQKVLKLGIQTSKDEVDFSNTVGTQGNPTILTKKAETSVILLDGQTTVIGGLSKETVSGDDSGVPWLMDIPLLGYLFKSQAQDSEMEEVLIFITPHILKEMETVQGEAPKKPEDEGLK
jgi:type IV pilus assembly protein PilQ